MLLIKKRRFGLFYQCLMIWPLLNYCKRDCFDFDMVNCAVFDGDVPHTVSCGVYISQYIRFIGASSRVNDFNNFK